MIKLKDLVEDLKGYEGLKYLLGKKGTVSQIGSENGIFNSNGISVFISKFGSYRYVKSVNGKSISALQIMSMNGKDGQIVNVYTEPTERRKGYGKELFNYAKKRFKTLKHSKDLSGLGRVFKKKVYGE